MKKTEDANALLMRNWPAQVFPRKVRRLARKTKFLATLFMTELVSETREAYDRYEKCLDELMAAIAHYDGRVNKRMR